MLYSTKFLSKLSEMPLKIHRCDKFYIFPPKHDGKSRECISCASCYCQNFSWIISIGLNIYIANVANVYAVDLKLCYVAVFSLRLLFFFASMFMYMAVVHWFSVYFRDCRAGSLFPRLDQIVLIVLLRLFVRNSSFWCQRKHTSFAIFSFSFSCWLLQSSNKDNLMLALTFENWFKAKWWDFVSIFFLSFHFILSTPTNFAHWQVEKCRLIYSTHAVTLKNVCFLNLVLFFYTLSLWFFVTSKFRPVLKETGGLWVFRIPPIF